MDVKHHVYLLYTYLLNRSAAQDPQDVDEPPECPMVSCVNGPTKSLSKLVDHWLQSHVASLSSHTKDTTHMLRMLQQ